MSTLRLVICREGRQALSGTRAARQVPLGSPAPLGNRRPPRLPPPGHSRLLHPPALLPHQGSQHQATSPGLLRQSCRPPTARRQQTHGTHARPCTHRGSPSVSSGSHARRRGFRRCSSGCRRQGQEEHDLPAGGTAEAAEGCGGCHRQEESQDAVMTAHALGFLCVSIGVHRLFCFFESTFAKQKRIFFNFIFFLSSK